MLTRRITTLLITILFLTPAFCQNIDSVIAQANKTSDTNSLKLVLGFIQSQVEINPDSALSIIEKAKPGFQNSNSDLLKGKVLNRKALALVKTGETDEALKFANTAEMIFVRLGYKKGIASCLNTKGMAKFYGGKFQEAQQYFIQAEKMYLELGLKSDALSTQQAQGAVLFQMGNLDQAEYVFLKAEQLALEINSDQTILYIWTNLGSVYNLKNQSEKAIEYYNKVLVAAPKVNNLYLEMSAASNLGSLYWSIAKLDEAIKAETRALQINDQLTDPDSRVAILSNLASAWASKKNYSMANKYIDEAIELVNSKKSENIDQLFKVKAQIKFAENDANEAYKWLEKHEHIKDSVLNATNQAMLTQLQVEHDQFKNEQTIKDLNNEKILNDQKLKVSQANTKIVVIVLVAIGVVLLISIIALINYASQKRVLKKKNQQIQESLKEKEILLQEVHHRVKNNLQMIYSILNLQTKNLSGDAAEILNESKDRVKSISLIHEKLYKNEDILQIDVGILLQEIADNVRKTSQFANNTKITTQCDDIKPEMDSLIALGIMVNELVTNCFKYACKNESENRVNIQLKKGKEEEIILKVTDNGVGFPSHFNMDNPSSFGFKMLKTLCKKLKGEIVCNNNNGADVTIILQKFKLATI